MGSRFTFLVLGLVVLFAACGDSKSKRTTARVAMRLDPSADLTTDFYAQPFPLETRRGADGTYELAGFPNPASYEIIEFFKEELRKGLPGYGTNAAAYVSFTGRLDFSAAETSASDTLAGKSPVLLVNVDKDSPDYKKFSPLMVKFYPGGTRFLPLNTLAAAPISGFPLRGGELYALVVVNDYGLRAHSGSVAQAPALAAALAGRGRWAETFAPLVEALPALEIATEKVIGATVYRTMDFAAPLYKARDWLVEEGPDPDPVIAVTDATFRTFHGTFTGARFQQGEAPYVTPGEGGFVLDTDGTPIMQGTERLRFAMRLPPSDPPVDGWPLVLYAHGTGGDYESSLLGDRREGYNLRVNDLAFISYDQPYHGDRNARVDDCVDECPQLYTFNFLNPPAARDGFRQSALDAVQLLRAALELRFQINGVGPEHFFNSDKIYYMGHSQGSTSGPMFVAAEKRVKAAVFSGPAGGLTLTLLYKTEPIDIPSIVGFFFGETEGVDLLHPLANLFQAYLEPVDPMNYARLIAKEPRDASLVRDVLATEGLTDEYTPPLQAEAFAVALGVPQVKPVFQDLVGFRLAGLDPVEPGFSGNLTNAFGKKWTGGLLQFPDNGHFAIYCNSTARTAYADFLFDKAYGGGANAEIADFGDRGWERYGLTDMGCSESSATAAPPIP